VKEALKSICLRLLDYSIPSKASQHGATNDVVQYFCISRSLSRSLSRHRKSLNLNVVQRRQDGLVRRRELLSFAHAHFAKLNQQSQ